MSAANTTSDRYANTYQVRAWDDEQQTFVKIPHARMFAEAKRDGIPLGTRRSEGDALANLFQRAAAKSVSIYAQADNAKVAAKIAATLAARNVSIVEYVDAPTNPDGSPKLRKSGEPIVSHVVRSSSVMSADGLDGGEFVDPSNPPF